jgi:hypothetical protein
VRLASDRKWRDALGARMEKAATQFENWEPGLAGLAKWLHERIAQMGTAE